jgi:hypothetical protein
MSTEILDDYLLVYVCRQKLPTLDPATEVRHQAKFFPTTGPCVAQFLKPPCERIDV